MTNELSLPPCPFSIPVDYDFVVRIKKRDEFEYVFESQRQNRSKKEAKNAKKYRAKLRYGFSVPAGFLRFL